LVAVAAFPCDEQKKMVTKYGLLSTLKDFAEAGHDVNALLEQEEESVYINLFKFILNTQKVIDDVVKRIKKIHKTVIKDSKPLAKKEKKPKAEIENPFEEAAETEDLSDLDNLEEPNQKPVDETYNPNEDI
jgi:hypothetical protein